MPTDAGGDAYLAAIPQLLMEWELGSQQEAALLTLIAQLPDLEVGGSVADRLGRAGVQILAPEVGDYRHTLVLSPQTGQILSSETLYIGHTRTDIPSPSVVAYYAWERN